MATQSALCGVCDSQQISKPSVIWCPECSEGLCEDCRGYHSHSRGTRHHMTILIAEYHTLPSDVLEITEFCSEHNERFQMYCKKHDRPCCRRCISDSHNMCIEIVVIDDVIKNVKTSNIVFEIEQRLRALSENTEKIRGTIRNGLDLLHKEKNKIQDDIELTRKIINDHLDTIQENLIEELTTIEDEENTKKKELLKSIEQTDIEIKNFKEKIDNLKEHASDLQVYLTVEKMEGDVTMKEEFLQAAVCSDKMYNVELTYIVDETLKNLSSKLKKFGTISMTNIQHELNLVSLKNKQAQLMVANFPHRSVDLITLNLERTVNTGLRNVRGCTLLPEDRMAFSSYYTNEVNVINKNGSEYFKLGTPHYTFDVEYVERDNTLVVTSSWESQISVICMGNKNIKKNIDVKSVNDGIAVLNNTLIFCARENGIRKLNPRTEDISDIVTSKVTNFSYITTIADKIYYTNPCKHEIVCCNMKGKKEWEFRNEDILVLPQGITVDSYRNVYVVGRSSNNVLVISFDGQHFRQLLSKVDGLNEPQVLHFDRSTNKLLVSNKNKTALLFNVT